MPQAVWNGTVVAESDTVETVEGNLYFPPQSLKREYFKPTEKHTHCPWKGDASYFTLEVDGQQNENAASTYPAPKPEAKVIQDYVAFWNGVEVRP